MIAVSSKYKIVVMKQEKVETYNEANISPGLLTSYAVAKKGGDKNCEQLLVLLVHLFFQLFQQNLHDTHVPILESGQTFLPGLNLRTDDTLDYR